MVGEDYIRGRLEGLFQLVSLLREIIGEEDVKSTIVQRLVEHIYAEIEEILEAVGEEAHPTIKKRLEEGKQSPSIEQKVTASYDVLSELIKKKGEGL